MNRLLVRYFSKNALANAFESTPSWSTKAVFKDAHAAAPVSQATLDAVSELAYIDVGTGAEESSAALRRDLGQMIAYVKVIQEAVLAQNATVEPRVSVADPSLRRAGLFDDTTRSALGTVLERDELLKEADSERVVGSGGKLNFFVL